MAIVDELNDRLKQAMKAKNEREVSALRMVRARIMDRQNEKGFSGEMTDELVQEIIGSYVKQLRKSVPEFQRGGEAARERVEALEFEIDYLSGFLPRLLDENATSAIVDETLATLGVTDPRRMGQVVGAIMKAHKGQVDPGLVRRLVEAKLDAGKSEAE